MKIDIAQLKYYHPRLRQILQWLERKTGLTFTVTSQYRIDDDGVHGTLPLRGTDLSCKVPTIGKSVERFINANWIYDPDRLNKRVARYHGPVPHLHIQVHPKTQRRE